MGQVGRPPRMKKCGKPVAFFLYVRGTNANVSLLGVNHHLRGDLGGGELGDSSLGSLLPFSEGTLVKSHVEGKPC